MVARSYETVTPEEYLCRERRAEFKSEYINGQIYAMAGASRQHVRITVNVSGSLYSQLRGKTCEPFAQALRLRASDTGLYTYPDVMVACEPLQFDDEQYDTLLNPAVIIEVLSPSTEAYDRGDKFDHYRRLPSLRDYVLIAQDKMRLEHFQREPDGSWRLCVAEGLDETIELSSIGCRLIVRDVYERVTFDDGPANVSPTASAEANGTSGI